MSHGTIQRSVVGRIKLQSLCFPMSGGLQRAKAALGGGLAVLTTLEEMADDFLRRQELLQVVNHSLRSLVIGHRPLRPPSLFRVQTFIIEPKRVEGEEERG